MKNILLIVCVLSVMPLYLLDADGEIFGITLDNTCKTFIKNNMTTNCPTYEELDLFYNDLECGYKDEVLCLGYFKQVGITDGYILDPSFDVIHRIKIINIRSNFEEYHFQDSAGYNNTAHTISYGLGRYVDECFNAYIDANQWFGLLGDTIMYLDSKCTKTYHTAERSVYLNQTVHNIEDSYKWQLEQWIKESKEKCLNKCFEY